MFNWLNTHNDTWIVTRLFHRPCSAEFNFLLPDYSTDHVQPSCSDHSAVDQSDQRGTYSPRERQDEGICSARREIWGKRVWYSLSLMKTLTESFGEKKNSMRMSLISFSTNRHLFSVVGGQADPFHLRFHWGYSYDEDHTCWNNSGEIFNWHWKLHPGFHISP